MLVSEGEELNERDKGWLFVDHVKFCFNDLLLKRKMNRIGSGKMFQQARFGDKCSKKPGVCKYVFDKINCFELTT